MVEVMVISWQVPDIIPRTTLLGRQSLHQYSACLCPVQRGFQEKGLLRYWTMVVDMLDGSGSRIRGLLLCLDTQPVASKTSDEALSLAQSASQP